MLRRASLPLSVSSGAPRNAGSQRSSPRLESQAAFFTLPARMHAVHTRTCFLTPATTARKRFRFGFHRRRRVLFAWLITFPKCGALPQNSHFSAIFLPAQDLFWASVSRSKYRKTKLLILADPPPPAKYAFCIPDVPSGRGVCALDGIAVFAFRMLLQSTRLAYPASCHSITPCSFVRDREARCVPVTPPIALKLQGLPAKKACRWPPVPLLTSFSTLSLALSMRCMAHALGP